jgi:mannose-6-phosphate isomerase-like protein (cupin superfamily)
MESAAGRIIELPRIRDVRGNLSFIEGGAHVPFEIRRVYWVYDVPGGEARGGHAHRDFDEFLVALSGSFDLELDTGDRSWVVSLNRSYYGVLVPRMTWRRLENFSTNAVCLVLASAPYREENYIRDREQFQASTRREGRGPA